MRARTNVNRIGTVAFVSRVELKEIFFQFWTSNAFSYWIKDSLKTKLFRYEIYYNFFTKVI